MINIFSYIRLVSYLLVAIISSFKLAKKMYTPITLIGDIYMAIILVGSVASYSVLGADYQWVVNYINTPAAAVWAIINYIDFLRCCARH